MIELITKFPTPWVFDEPERMVWRVTASNGEVIFQRGTCSGDGDEELNLDRQDWIDLVEIVNKAGI